MTKDAVDGLRMMANEFRNNAERTTSSQQQSAFAGRAMIAEGAANEIERLREANANLTADAPVMIEALKDARAALSLLFAREDTPQHRAMLACDAAIAAATD